MISLNSATSLTGVSSLSGLSSETRLYEFNLEGSTSAALQFEGFIGQEALSSLYRYEVLLLSDDANLDLTALLGKQAGFGLRLSDGSSFTRSGYVIEARHLGADGALSRYHLCLVPWLWQTTQSTHSRVFQEKSVLDIVQAVLAPYAPRALWKLAEGVESFMEEAPVRSLCVQYCETDYAFISRLLAEEGLGFCFVPADADGNSDTSLGNTPAWQMLIFSNNDSLPEDTLSAAALGGAGIRFHRADSQEEQDAVTALGGRRILQSAISTALSWDYKTRRSVSTSLPTAEKFGSENAPRIEDYDVPGPYAFAGEASASRYIGLQRQAIEARNKCFMGTGSVRSFSAGHHFILSNSPLDDEAQWRGETQSAEDRNASRHFLLTDVQHAGLNNLPADHEKAAQALRDLLEYSWNSGGDFALPGIAPEDAAGMIAQAQARGYANHFACQRLYVPWRPALTDATGVRLNPRPTAPGSQTALVVGAGGEDSGELIHTDALHRIRVRFHWQQGAVQDEASSTAWLRIASRYAGAGMGAQFVPRLGQEVLIGFLEGDVDRPIVLGSLYDGQGEDGVLPTPGGAEAADGSTGSGTSPFSQAADHQPAHQGNRVAGAHSPAWHGEASAYGPMRNRAAFSGFKSAEYNQTDPLQAGYNQLVFDDTDNQLRIQLATTQAATQLNLGHLIHQADNYRGSHRGDGFELRTDAYGALRGGKGLLLTSWPVQAAPDKAASEPAGDATAPVALLRQASELARSDSEIATTHKTVAVAAQVGSTGSAQSLLSGKMAAQAAMHQSVKAMAAVTSEKAGSEIPHSADAVLTIAGRAGLGIVAGQSLQWGSGENVTLASGQDSNYAIADKLRIHAGQALGMLSSAAGDGHLNAIAATGPVLVQAQSDTMQLAAKEQLKMVSVNAQLEVASPKKIRLAVAGGAAIVLEGGNITAKCPGTMTVHASKRSFVGPENARYTLPAMPRSEFRISKKFSFSS